MSRFVKTIALGLMFSNISSFGMLSKDVLFNLGIQGDGKVKNTLQKIDKFCNAAFSINNHNFLMNLDIKYVAREDIDKILFYAVWEKNNNNKQNKDVIERYQSYLNNKSNVIRIENFFNETVRGSVKGLISETLFSEVITFEEIEAEQEILEGFSDNCVLPCEILTFKTLPMAVLCNDQLLVNLFYDPIKQYRAGAMTWQRTIEQRYKSFRFLLLATAFLDKENMFKFILEKDLFFVAADVYDRNYAELGDSLMQINLPQEMEQKYFDIFRASLIKKMSGGYSLSAKEDVFYLQYRY